MLPEKETPVLAQVLSIAGVVVAGLVLLGVAFVVGFRAKSPLVLGPIVWFSRRYMNRVQLRSAGTPGAYASIVRHRGRRTGRDYETPVTAVADGHAFLVALPYGPRTSWLRNVLASGRATLVTEGETWIVGAPEIIPLVAVEDRFPPSDRRSHRLFGVTDVLRLHRVERVDPAAHRQAA